MTFHLTCVHIILGRFGLPSGDNTFWEIAANSVDHVRIFSLYFDYL